MIVKHSLMMHKVCSYVAKYVGLLLRCLFCFKFAVLTCACASTQYFRQLMSGCARCEAGCCWSTGGNVCNTSAMLCESQTPSQH